MASSPTRKPFEVFGDYILLKNLASGGMAEVFLARPARPGANGRILVIKRILREIANDPVFIKMFHSEIRTILGFNHPHTIQLHDSGEFQGQPYIAMEYIEGKSLREVTQKFSEKGEPIPVPTVLGLIAQAAAGLSYAHQFENAATGEAVNAVHRDISPHNLIVTYSGNLKVIDFGIAKVKNGIAEKTRAGQIKGKCGYLSPEQLAEENLDGRSDVFSLGIVAWELLTSQKLFQKNGDTELQVIKRIENCEQHIVPPSSLNPDITPEVDDVILKALAKHPDDRYSSAAAFQSAIRSVMQRQYPYYAYGDTGLIMRALFETDMLLERMELRELNDQAQERLAAEWEAKTLVVPKFSPRAFLESARLDTILHQKAGAKHFALFAFYLLSIVAIKLDDRYSLLDRLFLPVAQAEMGEDAMAAATPEALPLERPLAAPVVTAPLAPTRSIRAPVAKYPRAAPPRLDLRRGSISRLVKRPTPPPVQATRSISSLPPNSVKLKAHPKPPLPKRRLPVKAAS